MIYFKLLQNLVGMMLVILLMGCTAPTGIPVVPATSSQTPVQITTGTPYATPTPEMISSFEGCSVDGRILNTDPRQCVTNNGEIFTEALKVTAETLTPPLTQTPRTFMTPNALRLAYVLGGNLYVKVYDKEPVQLTDSGLDLNPIFSDDGEKIAFLRGTNPSDIYSINIDGSGEQAIVTTSQLVHLEAGYDHTTSAFDLSFLPGTHRLLFRTYQSQENAPALYNGDLLVVDTETAEIKSLLPIGKGGTYYASPNGMWIAIDSIGQIDMINREGKNIGKGLLTYNISEPSFLPAGIFWSPNSAELTVLMPTSTFFDVGDIPSYTVWRYVASEGKTQIPLVPLPRDYYMAKVSPDGKWILYNSVDRNAAYIGDLSTGHANPYVPDSYSFFYDWSWSPGSVHFVYNGSPGSMLYLGSVNGPPALIGAGDFIGWIDTNHYLYYAHNNIVMGDINGSQETILDAYESFKEKSMFTFILPKARN